MPFLSVIIPVYRVEKYLPQCIDSVLQQHLDSVEIILVDDGSPDGSSAICDAYAGQHECIRVIHKENGGLSSARNAGLQAANGEYVIFMDSDDWWNPDVSVAKMLEQVKIEPGTEMFLFTSLDFVEGEGLYQRKEHELLNTVRTDTVEHYYADLLKNGNLEVSAATKILKISFLQEHGLFFKEGIVSEDVEWMLRLLRKIRSVAIINQPLYICRLGRSDSITNTIGLRNVRNLLEIVADSIQYYSDDANEQTYRKYEYCYCAYLWFCALGLSGGLSNKEFRSLIPLFRQTSNVCRYSNSQKTKLAYAVYRLFGLYGARMILKGYLMAKNRFRLNKKKTADV